MAAASINRNSSGLPRPEHMTAGQVAQDIGCLVKNFPNRQGRQLVLKRRAPCEVISAFQLLLLVLKSVVCPLRTASDI